MEKVISKAVELLNENKSFVVATIVSDDNGGSPRTTGSKMIVMPDRSIFATIGGGSLEAMAINKAMDVFETKKHLLYTFNMTNKDASVADMVCGGIIDIYLDYIDANDPLNRQIFEAAEKAQIEGKKAWFVHLIGEDKRYFNFVQDGVIIGDAPENMHAQLKVPAFGLHMHPELTGDMKVYAEPVHSLNTAYIYGAGHVSQKIAEVLNMIGFVTIVIDDRADFANKDRFPNSKIVLLDDMKVIPPMDIDQNSYCIIVTRGHQHDRFALEAALQYDCAYIGMIGSKPKNAVVYQYLREKGYPQERLDFVHAPIGLSIGSETPAEIAVSIAAEIIEVKSKRAPKAARRTSC